MTWWVQRVNRKFSPQCKLGPVVPAVAGDWQPATDWHWPVELKDLKEVRRESAPIITGLLSTIRNIFQFITVFFSWCGSLRKSPTPPSNLQLYLSQRSLSLNLHSAASAFIFSLGLTGTWLLSSHTPSSTRTCPSTISPSSHLLSFIFPLLLPSYIFSFSAVIASSLMFWLGLQLKWSFVYILTSCLSFTCILCLYFLY